MLFDRNEVSRIEKTQPGDRPLLYPAPEFWHPQPDALCRHRQRGAGTFVQLLERQLSELLLLHALRSSPRAGLAAHHLCPHP